MVPHLGFEPKPLLYEGSVPATGRVTKMAGDRKIEFRSEVLETSVIPDHPLWGTRQDSNLHRTFVQPAFVARRLIQFTPLVHYKTWSARRDLNSRELAPRASASIQARLRADKNLWWVLRESNSTLWLFRPPQRPLLLSTRIWWRIRESNPSRLSCKENLHPSASPVKLSQASYH